MNSEITIVVLVSNNGDYHRKIYNINALEICQPDLVLDAIFYSHHEEEDIIIDQCKIFNNFEDAADYCNEIETIKLIGGFKNVSK